MKEIGHLNQLIGDGVFRFANLLLKEIDNKPVLEIHASEIRIAGSITASLTHQPGFHILINAGRSRAAER